jgi:RNA polymerase sigma-70 factor (ECF subfamily)
MEARQDKRRSAFEAVALPCAAAVHRFSLRLTRDPHTAADLVQEVFLRAYRSFDDFRTGSDCRAWLLSIAYSVFINMHRKDRRGPPIADLSSLESEPPASIEWNLRRDVWTRARIEQALLELPEEIRAVVLLVLIEELTYDEAARVLGCPIGTVRSRLFRGRRALLTALRDQAADSGFLGLTRKQ